MKDLLGNEITLPEIGDTIKHDGYTFRCYEIRLVEEPEIIASISFRNERGAFEIGYYEWLRHYKN